MWMKGVFQLKILFQSGIVKRIENVFSKRIKTNEKHSSRVRPSSD
jgi:hypothetical protein